MQKNIINSEKINKILKMTLEAIDKGRKEIFDISESVRKESEILKTQLCELQSEISIVIERVDSLEIEEKRSRTRLLIVSKNFDRYTEDDIKQAYEEANDLRIKLMLKRQEEKDMIHRRMDLEIRLRNSMDLLMKSEKLVTQVGVTMEYLSGDLDNIIETVEDMNKKQYLGTKILQAQEEERLRVSRDIHDGPAQSMANVVLKAELCEKLLSIDRDKAKEELKDLKEIVRNSLKDIRKIIYDLRPMSLDDLGLIPTVERYGYNFMEETGISVEVKSIGKIRKIDSIIQLAVFRIIQEALNNVRKHTKATTVKIKIETGLKYFNLVIKDNGIGFDADRIFEENSKLDSGFGIIGMKERAQLFNGKLGIKSSIGNGTTIVLIIPINREGDNDE